MRVSLSARFIRREIFEVMRQNGLSYDVSEKLANNLLMANIDVSVSDEGNLSSWKLTGIGVMKET
jgi:hypothetical protein